jgi:prepilin-type N-terminal cleavage/methylation domain-containing protein
VAVEGSCRWLFRKRSTRVARQDRGFTLIKLLVAIAIIAILASTLFSVLAPPNL